MSIYSSLPSPFYLSESSLLQTVALYTALLFCIVLRLLRLSLSVSLSSCLSFSLVTTHRTVSVLRCHNLPSRLGINYRILSRLHGSINRRSNNNNNTKEAAAFKTLLPAAVSRLLLRCCRLHSPSCCAAAAWACPYASAPSSTSPPTPAAARNFVVIVIVVSHDFLPDNVVVVVESFSALNTKLRNFQYSCRVRVCVVYVCMSVCVVCVCGCLLCVCVCFIKCTSPKNSTSRGNARQYREVPPCRLSAVAATATTPHQPPPPVLPLACPALPHCYFGLSYAALLSSSSSSSFCRPKIF